MSRIVVYGFTIIIGFILFTYMTFVYESPCEEFYASLLEGHSGCCQDSFLVFGCVGLILMAFPFVSEFQLQNSSRSTTQ